MLIERMPIESDVRKQIMGIATIGVILTHSNSVIDWPIVVERLLGYGGIGVYIFGFLSAIGLCYSLGFKKNNKKDFYKRRFIRVLLPYLLIAGTWYTIYDLIFMRKPGMFLYDLSTLSFWFSHRGAWYVAMLIPVYLLTPLFYDWMEKSGRNQKILGTLVMVMILSFCISVMLPDLYNHLSQVFCWSIVYLLGWYYVVNLNEGIDRKVALSVFCVIFFVIKTISPMKNLMFISNLSWGMLGIPTIFVSIWLLERLKNKPLYNFLSFFGNYSLEMYLLNIFMIHLFSCFGVNEKLSVLGDASGCFAYGIIVVGSCILSVLYQKISSILSGKLMCL